MRLMFQIFYLQKVGRGHWVEFSMAIIKIYKSRSMHFYIGSRHFKITFQIINLQKVSKSRGVQFVQLSHSMVNIKICKYGSMHFLVIALTISEIFRFQICYLQNGQDHELFLQWRHSMANIKIDTSCPLHFCASFNRFRNIVSNIWPSKSKSWSQSTISQWHNYMENIYKIRLMHFCTRSRCFRDISFKLLTCKK